MPQNNVSPNGKNYVFKWERAPIDWWDDWRLFFKTLINLHVIYMLLYTGSVGGGGGCVEVRN